MSRRCQFWPDDVMACHQKQLGEGFVGSQKAGSLRRRVFEPATPWSRRAERRSARRGTASTGCDTVWCISGAAGGLPVLKVSNAIRIPAAALARGALPEQLAVGAQADELEGLRVRLPVDEQEVRP